MKDKLIDFIENHRILSRFILIVIVFFLIILCMRFYVRGHKKPSDGSNQTSSLVEQEGQALEEENETETSTKEKPTYDNSLGLDTDKGDGRITVAEPTESTKPTKAPVIKPSYPVTVSIYDKTQVPARNVDGSSCTGYLNSVVLRDFGTYWGSDLTVEDFYSKKIVYVGVDQDPNDTQKEDLQSVGWLIENLDSLSSETAIKFTNLHVIGNLSTTHVAILCSYDWYSAFGLDDTLVVFEDISGTLKLENFSSGDIFSATVFRHNVKSVNVNGKRVIVVQYNIYKD